MPNFSRLDTPNIEPYLLLICLDFNMIHSYLLANSGVAKVLLENTEVPVTLEELLMSYCETNERFVHVIKLLEKLPQFETDLLKISNCMIDGTLPYDSLIGLSKSDLEILYELIDYLDLPKALYEKLGKVIDKDTNWGPYTIKEFVKNGDLRGMKYLHEEKGFALHKGLCAYAAENGHLECLQYAHAPTVGKRCPWDERTCEYAAENGHLECLKYAHAPPVGKSCPWDEETCNNAAKNGHLECLKYAHIQGCPWNAETCATAAGNGHLECLKYAHEQNCPWDSDTCKYAAQNGHLECLKYACAPTASLVGERCPWNKTECLKYAKTPEIRKWIEKN